VPTRARAVALTWLARMEGVRGHRARARTLGAAAVAVSRASGDRHALALALRCLGLTTWEDGGSTPAVRATLEEAVAGAREAAHARELGYSQTLLGKILHDLGEPVAGPRLMTEARRLLRQVGDRDALATNLSFSSLVALRRGEPAAARALLEEGLRLLLEIGHPLAMSAQVVLGDLARAEDDAAGARARYAAALHAARDRGVATYPWPVANALRGLAGLSVAAGDSLRAARLFGAAAAGLDAGWTVHVYGHRDDRSAADAQAAALAARHDPALAAARAEGAAMTLDEAVAYALGDGAGAPPSTSSRPPSATRPWPPPGGTSTPG
jgi:hypothetical protein